MGNPDSLWLLVMRLGMAMNISILRHSPFSSLWKFKSKFFPVFHQFYRHYWADVVIGLLMAIAGGLAAYAGQRWVDPIIVSFDTFNSWFDGDMSRVFDNMSDRMSRQLRGEVHPLFSLLTFPIVRLLTKLLHASDLSAIGVLLAIVAAFWLGTMFVLLRLIGCRRLDAMLFSALGAISAAAMFWFTVPETYPFGSLSIVFSLCLLSLSLHYELPGIGYMLVNTLTLGTTITNGMVGLWVTKVNHTWGRFYSITFKSLCLFIGLWVMQQTLFPPSSSFLGVSTESTFFFQPKAGGLLVILRSLLVHTMVMPKIAITPGERDWPRMAIQASAAGSSGLLGAIAVGLWVTLLGLGVWALFSLKQYPKLRIALGGALLGQMALHSVYGEETFLYAAHFLPLLVVLSALSVLTRARPISLVLAGLLLLTAGSNNVSQFQKATELYTHYGYGTQRHQTQVQMRSRPQDFWPRGTGHVVLATPGSQESAKGYHEPGGSFSPRVGSFGASLWVVDRQANVVATSDTIPLDQIQQKFIDSPDRSIPQIQTQTKYYQATWAILDPTHWQLTLKASADAETTLIPVIRSVGAAGNPIYSLDWDGKRLLINDRWKVIVSLAKTVYLGSEQRGSEQRGSEQRGSKSIGDWKQEKLALHQWQGKEGWGYARFDLANAKSWTMTIEDTAPSAAIDLPVAASKPALKLKLPNSQFANSLKAQVAHLKMGLVGNQTRPGDPTHYPIPWQRHGAYEIASLARAGEVDLARRLSTYLAENDFTGGFGPEADAPGLSIWALGQVANQLNDPQYDQWLWTHVRRKAEFILTMLSAKAEIHQPVVTPIVPKIINDDQLSYASMSLVAAPPQNGLIITRMELDDLLVFVKRPLLFANAVSYRGLLDAADFAQRTGHPEEAKRWRDSAVRLKQAWEKGFVPPESTNDRTYASSLWPSWIAKDIKSQLLDNLQQRWHQKRDPQGGFYQPPLRTYFDIAEAHQWLFLNQPEPVWKTLQWFWQHQASPGMYTWWEGKGEENTYERWQQVRGWINPPHITPHYWTAAEMLLLQLDMLAYTDRSADKPTIVIGGGIPTEWLKQPMQVDGLFTLAHQVNWQWNGKAMNVQIRGSRVEVKLGAAFPPNTPVQVEYLG
jgi:hypothetical protein